MTVSVCSCWREPKVSAICGHSSEAQFSKVISVAACASRMSLLVSSLPLKVTVWWGVSAII